METPFSVPSLAATKAERQALDETKAIFQKSIDANDDLASWKDGVTEAKPGLTRLTFPAKSQRGVDKMELGLRFATQLAIH